MAATILGASQAELRPHVRVRVCLCVLCCLQELGKFLVRASNLLADLHQLLIPVTVSKLPPGRSPPPSK